MPRSRRAIHTEKPYHVYNRGNYKGPVFGTMGAARAFIEVLDETVSRFEWELYAFAIMPNHFHLCVRTPNGNLSASMHHLLTTFCSRFNRFRGESGHVFQGRFSSKPAPKGMSVRRIIDYIHLNPKRAGLATLEQTAGKELTSLRDYVGDSPRPWVATKAALERYLGFEDTPRGREAHLAALRAKAPESTAEFQAEWASLARAERREERKASGGVRPERLKTAREVRLEAEDRWERLAADLMAQAGLAESDMPSMTKRHPAKMALATELRKAGANYRWIAQRLHAGTPEYLSFCLRTVKGSGPDIGPSTNIGA